ncbi:MAG: tetratricopeptide repeat protein [Candidatus Rokubacteria bacterium]|nr:tetratricopeptide repeat protein [Candidatus Rokubacteria bacterium]
MNCPGCGFGVSPDFAFCPRCGARLGARPAEAAAPASPAPVVREPAPSREIPPPARTDTVRPGDERPDEGDRRLVTVLFADLSGFTALSERVDPEEIRAFQNDLFREMSVALERYGGFVEKFVGDAVMAVFGAPHAHEDDPERALHAALLMHERVATLNRRWERRLGKTLALHIGVNTGPVVAGTLGSASAGAYAVTGDTVNTASRLQSAAQPGETLVSLSTHQLTQHAFLFEPLGEVTIKGKNLPVQVYRVTGRRRTQGSARGLEAHGLVAPMVGRADELGQMVAAFDRMVRGRAQVVSLVGEAGVGKSRLLREFFQTLEDGQRLGATTVRRAVCSSLGEQPYGVFATFIRDAYGVAPDDPLEVAQDKLASGLTALGADEVEPAAIAPVLGYVLGVEAAERFRHVEPEQLKRQIFLALRRLVERRLQQGPLVLVVEDLHWADAASVELLQFLVDRLADRQLMLVATYRPSFDPRALATSRASHTALRLTPLSPGDSEALLSAYFGPSAGRLPPRLRQLVLQRAGGHPLYLEEIVRSLIAGGVLVRGEDGWTGTADAATVQVPPTIHGLLLARVDRLPADARRVLHEAAVLGPVCDVALLRRIASAPTAVEAALKVLQDNDLLEEAARPLGEPVTTARTDRAYRFTHVLLQEVVYQSLLVRRRVELHGRAGRALEAMAASGPKRLEDVEVLGHHFSMSDEKLKGARYLVAAGDWARGMYANDDAVRHYKSALATLRECDGCEEEQWAVRERLGDLLAPMGGRAAALAHYEAVLAAFATAEDRPAQARLQRKIASLYWEAGDRAVALARLQAGLSLLEGRVEHIELAHLYQEMGRLAFRSGDNRRAIDWAQRALAQAEPLTTASPEPDTPLDAERRRAAASAVAQAYNTLGVALARTGRLRDAVGHIERSVAVAEAHDLLQAACRGYTNLGVLYSALDPKRAIETCTHGLEMAKKIGDLGLQSRLNTNLAVAYCALTNRCEEQGLSAAQAALDLDRQLGQLDHLAVPLIVLGQIHQCHGDPELALKYYREALELVEQIGEPQLLFPCYDGLATLYLDRGDEPQAEEFMVKAQRVCEEAGLEPDSLVVLPFLE